LSYRPRRGAVAWSAAGNGAGIVYRDDRDPAMPRFVLLLAALGARCGLTLVSGGQISRSCAIAVVPPRSLNQMADPAAMRLIFQLFLNFINYFLFYRKFA
jgi:hypothetical protein